MEQGDNADMRVVDDRKEEEKNEMKEVNASSSSHHHLSAPSSSAPSPSSSPLRPPSSGRFSISPRPLMNSLSSFLSSAASSVFGGGHSNSKEKESEAANNSDRNHDSSSSIHIPTSTPPRSPMLHLPATSSLASIVSPTATQLLSLPTPPASTTNAGSVSSSVHNSPSDRIRGTPHRHHSELSLHLSFPSHATISSLSGFPGSSALGVGMSGISSTSAMVVPLQTTASAAHATSIASLSPSTVPSVSSTPPSSSGVSHRRTNSRDRFSSTSLVPRHDYIPAYSLRSPRIVPPLPSSSPTPPGSNASTPTAHAAAAANSSHANDTATPSLSQPLPAASQIPVSVLKSTPSVLVPVASPSFCVPPSPAPAKSPYKSILRTRSTPTTGEEKGGVNVQVMARALLPPTPRTIANQRRIEQQQQDDSSAPSSHSLPPRHHHHSITTLATPQHQQQPQLSQGSSTSNSGSDSSQGTATTEEGETNVTRVIDPASMMDTSDSNPGVHEHTAAHDALSRVLAEAEVSQTTRRSSLRTPDERKHSSSASSSPSASPPRLKQHHRLAHSFDTLSSNVTSPGMRTRQHHATSFSVDSSPLLVTVELKGRKSNDEHKSAINPNAVNNTNSSLLGVPTSSLDFLRPISPASASTSASASASNSPTSTPRRSGRTLIPHSAPPARIHHHPAHKHRVRFDRAEIHEFSLIPDASKVPGGDGEYAIGMDRTPHSSFIASLDLYDRLREKQRKVDGPDAIEEDERKKIWIQAQASAEKMNEIQRRKSGIRTYRKETHPSAAVAAATTAGMKRKRVVEEDADDDDDDEEEEGEDDEAEQNEDDEDEEMDDAPLPSTVTFHHATIVPFDLNDTGAPHTSSSDPAASDEGADSDSRPPSPSSACFRFVAISPTPSSAAASSSDFKPTLGRPPTPAALNRMPSHKPSLNRAHSAPSPSLSPSPPPPIQTQLIFSDHDDLSLIRASRRTAGCQCRGSKTVKVCGSLEEMQAQMKKREVMDVKKSAALVKKMHTGTGSGGRHSKAAKMEEGATAATSSPTRSSSSADSPPLQLCPCVASGVGCNSNICRCFGYCCMNTQQERYAFNQAKVNKFRKELLKELKAGGKS